jgi:hypothetical protein
MRSRAFVLLASLSLLLPVAAARADRQEMQLLEQEAKSGRCDAALKRANRLLARRDLEDDARSAAVFVPVACFYAHGRPTEARAAALSLARHPPAALTLFGWYVMAAHNRAGEHAVEALERAIAEAPDFVRLIDPAFMGDTRRVLRDAGQREPVDRTTLMLADIGFGGNDLAVRDSYSASAVRLHMAAGRRADAERLLFAIVSRATLIEMLTDRRLEALWPALETSAGPGMMRTSRIALAAARDHASAMGPAEASPRAAQARETLLYALWDAGEQAEALAEGGRALARAEAIAAAGEAQGWLLNEHALLLAAAGDVGAADARLRALTETYASGRRWIISMLINRALMLTDAGRYDAVLALVPQLVEETEAHGTPYARQLVRSAHACALAGAGRSAEARALRSELLAHAEATRTRTAGALLCLGDEEAAAKLLVDALADERQRLGAIESLQPEGTHRLDPRVLNLRPLLARAEVSAAFAREGRELPPRLRMP